MHQTVRDATRAPKGTIHVRDANASTTRIAPSASSIKSLEEKPIGLFGGRVVPDSVPSLTHPFANKAQLWQHSCSKKFVIERAKLFAVLFLCGLAPAQNQQPPQDEAPEAVFRVGARLVEVHATVKDKSGRLLTDLPQSNFHIFENDVPQEMKVFRREDAPVSLGLIIDSSGSMQPRRAQVAAAALTLVRASNKDDEVFIMTFNDRPALVQDFTQDIHQLETSLNKIEPAGATAMRDALILGVDHLKRLARREKKMLLVVTDGEDNSSFEELNKLVRSAQQSDILIYAIGLLSEESERSATRAKHDLDTITFATGGEAFYPHDVSEVDGIAQHVARDLRNQYTIAYYPTDEKQDSTFRRIRLTVDVPGAVVKTRTGYFADPLPKPRSE
jgi:Ca-activated chloride channel homolog